jgi:transcriptional regulator with XRE-family HTH domain
MKMVDKVLRKARELGIKQAELARVAAAAPARITDWKTGDWEPSIGQLLRIGQRLGLSLDYLTNDSIDVQPTPISADDMAILATVHALSLELPVVIRALHRVAGESIPSASTGYMTVIATRDLTESDIRREKEAKAASFRDSEREDKGADLANEPTRKR